MAMIKKIDIGDNKIAADVLGIQLKSYKIEAELIKYNSLPPLKESLNDLLASMEEYYGYFINKRLVGFIAIEGKKENITISKLVVDPNCFRQGIGGKLVSFIERINNLKTIRVSTAAKNLPAINLYKNHGFKKVKEITIGDGLIIIEFEKNIIVK